TIIVARTMWKRLLPAAASGMAAAALLSAQAPRLAIDWPSHGHDPGAARYSPLRQINTENVAKLKLAWTYDTPATVPPPARRGGGPGHQPSQRGLSYWPGMPGFAPRLVFGTTDGSALLIALDAKTGEYVPTFGDGGKVELRRGVGDKFPELRVALSSPPAIYKHLAI